MIFTLRSAASQTAAGLCSPRSCCWRPLASKTSTTKRRTVASTKRRPTRSTLERRGPARRGPEAATTTTTASRSTKTRIWRPRVKEAELRFNFGLKIWLYNLLHQKKTWLTLRAYEAWYVVSSRSEDPWVIYGSKCSPLHTDCTAIHYAWISHLHWSQVLVVTEVRLIGCL